MASSRPLGGSDGRRSSSPPESRPAFYAAPPGRWRDWWTILHPPYTAWHLSYVVIGAALRPRVDATILAGTLLAFFLAVGVAAHVLDELRGRPLRTAVSDRALVLAGVATLAGSVIVGIAGLSRTGPVLVPFLVAGPVLVLGYNLELFGGRLHTDHWFALAWGAFPLLTSYAAQAGRVDLVAVVGAGGAATLAAAQRSLSTPARFLRRKVRQVEGTITTVGGTPIALDGPMLLAPLEQALRALSWSVVLTATAMAIARLV